jgi:hypothetical protein
MAVIDEGNYRLLIQQLVLCNDEIERLQNREKDLLQENGALMKENNALKEALATQVNNVAPPAAAAPRSLLHSASCSTLGTLASDADAFSTTAVASAVCQAEPGLVCTITANNISMIKSLAAPPKMVHTVLAACCIIFNHVPKRVKGAKADTVVDWGSCKAFLSTTSPQKFKRFKIADFNGDYHELQSLVNCIDLGVAASSASALVPIAKWVIAVADILEGQHLESPQSTPVKHLRPSKGKRSGSGKGTPVNAPKANRDR